MHEMTIVPALRAKLADLKEALRRLRLEAEAEHEAGRLDADAFEHREAAGEGMIEGMKLAIETAERVVAASVDEWAERSIRPTEEDESCPPF